MAGFRFLLGLETGVEGGVTGFKHSLFIALSVLFVIANDSS